MQNNLPIDVIRHPFTIPVAPGITLSRFVYSYVIYSDKITLIDTGVSGCEAEIFNTIHKKGREPSEIERIILTHSHPDHIGAALAVQRATGCSVAAHPAEKDWIENIELQNSERPVPGFFSLIGGSVKIDCELSDGDIILTDDKKKDMEVIHTPGHSPGSISLFMKSYGALFCGDVIPVKGDLPVYDDALLSLDSIKKLRSLNGVNILLSAWDEPKKGKEAYRQMDNAADYLHTIHKAVLSNATHGRNLMEITQKAAAELGIPPQAVNPLLARTFAANLNIRDKKCLLNE